MTGTLKRKEFVIWSSEINVEEDGWKEDYNEYCEANDMNPGSCYDMYDYVTQLNDEYFDDECCNLNIQLSEKIFVIADLGLCNGRHYAYSEIDSGNISDCLRSNYNSCTWYVDCLGDLRCRETHHVGKI